MKQHAEMSLFVKHVDDKQHSLFFSDSTVDIAMPSPCTASANAISVEAFRWRTRSDHVTRNALAAQNNAAYGQGTLWTIRLRLACVQSRPPTDISSPIFSEGRWWLYTGYLERIIPSSEVRRIVHSNLKLFHFQIKTYYLSDANHQTGNPSHTNNPSQV